MAYTITIRTPHDPPKRAADGVTVAGVSRSCRVATLEEAREILLVRIASAGSDDLALATIPESGGTVGPLPDGSAITVVADPDPLYFLADADAQAAYESRHASPDD